MPLLRARLRPMVRVETLLLIVLVWLMATANAGWWGAVYLYEPTPGIAAAASAGYDAAGCDLIARLDADSEPPTDWVANLIAAFVDDPELDAITGPGRFPTLPRRSRLLADQTYLRPYFALMGRLLGHPPLFGSNL